MAAIICDDFETNKFKFLLNNPPSSVTAVWPMQPMEIIAVVLATILVTMRILVQQLQRHYDQNGRKEVNDHQGPLCDHFATACNYFAVVYGHLWPLDRNVVANSLKRSVTGVVVAAGGLVVGMY